MLAVPAGEAFIALPSAFSAYTATGIVWPWPPPILGGEGSVLGSVMADGVIVRWGIVAIADI